MMQSTMNAVLTAGLLLGCAGGSGSTPNSDGGGSGADANTQCFDSHEPNDTDPVQAQAPQSAAIVEPTDIDRYRFSGTRQASEGQLVVQAAIQNDTDASLIVELQVRCAGLTGTCTLGTGVAELNSITCISDAGDSTIATAYVDCASFDAVFTVRAADGTDGCVPYRFAYESHDL